MDERIAVRVSISSLQNLVTEETDTKENNDKYVFPGEYWTKDGKYYINYVEESEGLKIVNRILATDSSAIINKAGADVVKSHLKFANGLRYASEYKIPYGTFYMEVDTKEYEMKVFDENQKDVLAIHMCYDVYMNEQYISRNNINIKVVKIL